MFLALSFFSPSYVKCVAESPNLIPHVTGYWKHPCFTFSRFWLQIPALKPRVTQHNFQGFPQSPHSKKETVPPTGTEGFILHQLKFTSQSASCHSRLCILTGGLVSNPQTNKPSPGRYRQAVPTTSTLLLLTGGLCASQMEVGWRHVMKRVPG